MQDSPFLRILIKWSLFWSLFPLSILKPLILLYFLGHFSGFKSHLPHLLSVRNPDSIRVPNFIPYICSALPAFAISFLPLCLFLSSSFVLKQPSDACHIEQNFSCCSKIFFSSFFRQDIRKKPRLMQAHLSCSVNAFQQKY